MADYAKLDVETTNTNKETFDLHKQLVQRMKTDAGPAAKLAKSLGNISTVKSAASGATAPSMLQAFADSVSKTFNSVAKNVEGYSKGGGFTRLGGGGGVGGTGRGLKGPMAKQIDEQIKY